MSHYMPLQGPSRRAALLGFALLLLGGCAPATVKQKPIAIKEPPPVGPVELRADHPEAYTVTATDTLWDVADRFLNKPWHWGNAWRQKNGAGEPELIYPGDVIAVNYRQDGEPELQLANGERPTVKLSPQVRVETISQPVPAVPRDVVAPFISNSVVRSDEEWKDAPYVVGSADERVIMFAGTRVFVRAKDDFEQRRYRVFRPGEQYRDPDSHAALGYAMTYLGEAELLEDGDPAVFQLTNTRQEVRAGDRLLGDVDDSKAFSFLPRPAPLDTDGQVIATLGENQLNGRYANIVVNLGAEDGMVPGTVLAVFQPGRKIKDPLTGSKLISPEQRSGLVMLYKVFDRVSYGLVTEATQPIRVKDRVGEP